MKDGQIIIAIGREFGSGGRDIARAVAEKLDCKLYDKNMLLILLDEDPEEAKRYDERPRVPLLSRRVRNFSSSQEDILAQRQFDLMKQIAESGETFVIVGRCAETILKDYPGLVSVYVHASEEFKLKKVEERYEYTEAEARRKIRDVDNSRRKYHNEHSEYKWGDYHAYDLCINRTKLTDEQAVDLILNYMEAVK